MFNALFSAKGRMRRRDWWLWSIGIVLVYFITEVFIHGFFGVSSLKNDMAFKGLPSNIFQYWVLIGGLASEWPRICVLAKRWHDRNRPGWLAVVGAVLSQIQVVLLHFDGSAGGFTSPFVVGAIQGIVVVTGVIFWIWVLIDCGILDGTQGQNRYGPSPKGLGAGVEDVF